MKRRRRQGEYKGVNFVVTGFPYPIRLGADGIRNDSGTFASIGSTLTFTRIRLLSGGLANSETDETGDARFVCV